MARPLGDVRSRGMGPSIPVACRGSSLEGERAKVGEARLGRGDCPWGYRGEFGRVVVGVSPAEKAVGVPGPSSERGWDDQVWW